MRWVKRLLTKMLIKDLHKKFLRLQRQNKEKDVLLASLGCSLEELCSVKKRIKQLEEANAKLEEEKGAIVAEGIAWADEAQASRVVIADLNKLMKTTCDRCGDSGELCTKCPFYDIKEILARADEKPIVMGRKNVT